MGLEDQMPQDRPEDWQRRFRDVERTVRELQAALQLTQGSLSNALLKSPVRGDVMRAYALNFTVPLALTTLATQDWAFPEGFNQCQVWVIAKAFAYNPTAGLDYLTTQARITRVSDGSAIPGIATPVAVSGSNGSGTSISLATAVINAGSPADSVRLEARAQSSFAAWAANAGNTIEVSGALTWYRV